MTNNQPKIRGDILSFNPVPQFPNCKTIDISDHFSEQDVPRQIFLRFKKVENLGIEIYLLDKNFASRRSLKSQLLAYNGPTISNPDLGRITKTDRIILKITQTKDAEEDDSKGCRVYPNKRFESFGDCDGHFVHENMKLEGLMPFWATVNLKEVTSCRFYNFNESGDYVNLLDGTLESDCPTPCLRTKVSLS